MNIWSIFGLGRNKQISGAEQIQEEPREEKTTKKEGLNFWLTDSEIRDVERSTYSSTAEYYTNLAQSRKSYTDVLKPIEEDVCFLSLHEQANEGEQIHAKLKNLNVNKLEDLFLNLNDSDLNRTISFILLQVLEKYKDLGLCKRGGEYSYKDVKNGVTKQFKNLVPSDVVKDILTAKSVLHASKQRALSAARLSACKKDEQ